MSRGTSASCLIQPAIAEADGVCGVHDLHLWSLAGDDASLTAHVELADAAEAEPVRVALIRMLGERFAVHHVTLQLEPPGFDGCTGHDEWCGIDPSGGLEARRSESEKNPALLSQTGLAHRP